MRITIRNGVVVKCDAEVPKTPDQLAAPGGTASAVTRCPQQFPSYSAVSVIRAQAVAAGWGRVWAWQVTGDMAATARIKQDVCPEHRAIAETNAARREEIVKAQREQIKTTKAAEKEQQLAAKLAARAQIDNERAEKKAAKLKAKADRKAERAAKKNAAEQKKVDAHKWRRFAREEKERKKAEKAARSSKKQSVTEAGTPTDIDTAQPTPEASS